MYIMASMIAPKLGCIRCTALRVEYTELCAIKKKIHFFRIIEIMESTRQKRRHRTLSLD